MAVKYFLYSREQDQFRRKVEAGMGKNYHPGMVIANGVSKPYTEISSTPSSKRYPDAVIVTSGEIENIRYRAPYSVRRGGR